jgi:geranylgeranyl reductase family protein
VDADVIVVGAGPAGAVTACGLARDGLDVMLLDRRSFPRDKACGDGVPPGSIEILNSLGMADKIRSAGFYPINGIRLGSPSGRTWDASFRPKREGTQFYIAPRALFDALIQGHAVESGARFVQCAVKAPVIDAGCITGVHVVVDGHEKELTARVVVGADGATSAIARAVRTRPKPPSRRRSVAIRAYVDGIDTIPHRVEFYLHRRFLPGYAWVFPLGSDRANVGVIMRADRYRATGAPLERLMREFTESPVIADRLQSDHQIRDVASWQLPNAAPVPMRNTFDGALLVGDAASLVDPLTGEGIHNALVSAQLAAQAIGEAVRGGDTSCRGLSAYDRRCDEVLGPLVARSQRVHNWVDRVPGWIDPLFALAGAVPGRAQSILNRMSTDFVVHVDG